VECKELTTPFPFFFLEMGSFFGLDLFDPSLSDEFSANREELHFDLASLGSASDVLERSNKMPPR